MEALPGYKALSCQGEVNSMAQSLTDLAIKTIRESGVKKVKIEVEVEAKINDDGKIELEVSTEAKEGDAKEERKVEYVLD